MAKVFTHPYPAVAALIERDGKFLLIQEDRPQRPWHGQWTHPAGTVDLNENPYETIIREVEEEAGGMFVPESILGIYSLARPDQPLPPEGNMHGVKIVFLGKYGDGPGAKDSSGIAWFTPEEIDAMDSTTLRDVDIKDIVKDYLSGTRFPLSILHHHVVER